MTGGDSGLEMELGEFAADGRLSKVEHAAGDHRTIPEAAVLFFEKENIAIDIGTSRQAGGIEKHEREQGVSGGTVSRFMFGQQPGEPDGLVAQIFPHQLVAAGSFVAFVEQQIQRLQYAIESLREFRT